MFQCRRTLSDGKSSFILKSTSQAPPTPTLVLASEPQGEQTQGFALERQRLLFIGLGWQRGAGGLGPAPQKMQVQPTAMVSMTARWRQGPVRGGSGQRRRRTGTWLNTGTLTMLRSSCMVKGFTQPRHKHRASGRSAGMRVGSWLMLQEDRREAGLLVVGCWGAGRGSKLAPPPLLSLTPVSIPTQDCVMH